MEKRMAYPVEGTFHSDDGADYPARMLHEYAGTAALDVDYPEGHPAHADNNLLHIPSDGLDRVFTAAGGKPSARAVAFKKKAAKARPKRSAGRKA